MLVAARVWDVGARTPVLARGLPVGGVVGLNDVAWQAATVANRAAAVPGPITSGPGYPCRSERDRPCGGRRRCRARRPRATPRRCPWRGQSHRSFRFSSTQRLSSASDCPSRSSISETTVFCAIPGVIGAQGGLSSCSLPQSAGRPANEDERKRAGSASAGVRRSDSTGQPRRRPGLIVHPTNIELAWLRLHVGAHRQP